MHPATRRLLLGAGTAATAAVGMGVAAAWGAVQLGMPQPPLPPEPWADTASTARSRKEQLRALRAGKEFDVLIIGGEWDVDSARKEEEEKQRERQRGSVFFVFFFCFFVF